MDFAVNKSNEQLTSVDVARPSADVILDSSLPSKIRDYVENKVQSVSLGDATTEVKISTFEVNKRADSGQDGKGSQTYPTFKVSNLSKVPSHLCFYCCISLYHLTVYHI